MKLTRQLTRQVDKVLLTLRERREFGEIKSISFILSFVGEIIKADLV